MLFARKKSGPGGFSPICKECQTITVRNWRKTGCTNISEFDGISAPGLLRTFALLKKALKKKGYELTIKKEI